MNKSKLYRKLTIFGLVIYIILLAAILVIRKVDGELFDYVRWPFFVFSLVLAGIICLIKGINKKIKFKEINSDVVDGEIIAFVEQITLGGQNVYKETVLTYNEELLGSGTKFGTKKLYIPVFRYIYNDVEHTYRATAQFSISKVRKQNLHIGKRVELLVNRNDGSVYAPMEKRIGVLIALGILLIALGILLIALGIEILYW